MAEEEEISFRDKLKYLGEVMYQVNILQYVGWTLSIDFSNGFHPYYYCKDVESFEEFEEGVNKAYDEVKKYRKYMDECDEEGIDNESFSDWLLDQKENA